MEGSAQVPASRRTMRAAGIALVALFLLLWFGGLDHRKLVEPDEGRYAEVAREMMDSGDFITPRLNGFKHFTKPPLQYWMSAIAFRLFGPNEWTARLWSALAGMVALLTVLFTMRALYGSTVATGSAAVLSSSLYFVFFAQVGTLDMGLTLSVTAAMCAIMLALNAPPESKAERNWMRVAWTAMGLAVLAKGLIGVVFPLMVAGLYALAQRQLGAWRRLHPVEGVVLLSIVAAPWFVAVSLRNPEFPAFFFIEEHVERFVGTGHRRSKPFWFYVPLLLVGLLPWTWVALEGALAGWRAHPADAAFRPARFLAIWAASIVLFFSLSGSKMPAYVLPAIPALAMLAGLRLSALNDSDMRRRVLPLLASMGVAVVVAAAVLPGTERALPYRHLYQDYARWLFAAGVLLLAGAILIGLLRVAGVRLLASVAMVTLASVQSCILGFESLSALRSSHAIAQEIARRATPDTEIFMVGASYLTLPFYLGRTVVLAQETGQMSFGVRLEPARALLAPGAFASAWAGAPAALALMHRRNFDEARAAGVDMRVLCQDAERVLTIKPAAAAANATGQDVPDCVRLGSAD